MTLFLRRLLLAIFCMSVGGVAGWHVGRVAGVPLWGAWLGASVGLFLCSLRDSMRSQALMNWLRGSMEDSAPRAGELWGDIGYRIERALLLRARSLAAEQKRLADFLSAIEASPNGVLLIDATEHIGWCNSAAADHFGLDPIRDRGQRITNLVRVPAFVEYMQVQDYHEPLTLLNPARGLTLSILIRPYGDRLRLILSSDITERLRTENMRRDFVANVSHEIGAPLTVLAGYVDAIGNPDLSDSQRKRVLGQLTEQTRRMQVLVADLLTLAELEGSPRPPVDHWIAVRSLLAQIEAEMRALSKGRHVLSLSFGDSAGALSPSFPDCLLAGSETELASAFINLCSNAIRYTPEGGRIDVSWHVRTGGEGVFEVRDSGIGIAREHLPRLTERFYRVDGSRSRDTGGTGLGLSIVKHVMQHHGGQLEVESEPGRGSCFRLVFPAARVRIQGRATVDGEAA